jgi:NADPH:quinone reductase
MMDALVLEEFNGPLIPRRLARPSPAAGQVVIEVAASAVNPLDLKIRTGTAAHARVNAPAILGIDMAGTVVELGAGVDAFAIGDAVYGMAGGVGDLPGSLEQFMAVDADLLAPRPASLDARSAAALPLSVITAWEGMYEHANVSAHHRVLVHGGAGSVGASAVQLAVARGATVVATGTGASLDVIESLGAQPVDRHELERGEPVGEFDVVFDTVGGETLQRSFDLVTRRTGRVVSILGWGSHSLAPLSFRGATYSGVFTLQPLLDGVNRARHGNVLREANALIDAGLLAPQVDPHRFTLESAEDAHDLVRGGGSRGKVVVDVGSPQQATST